jgi:hypothetical protein
LILDRSKQILEVSACIFGHKNTRRTRYSILSPKLAFFSPTWVGPVREILYITFRIRDRRTEEDLSKLLMVFRQGRRMYYSKTLTMKRVNESEAVGGRSSVEWRCNIP